MDPDNQSITVGLHITEEHASKSRPHSSIRSDAGNEKILRDDGEKLEILNGNAAIHIDNMTGAADENLSYGVNENSEHGMKDEKSHMQQVRESILERVTLSSLTVSSLTSEQEDTIDQFILHPHHRTLFVYVNPTRGLIVDFSAPQSDVAELMYFLKKDTSVSLADVDLQSVFTVGLRYGRVAGRHVESVLRLMHGLFLPALRKTSAAWPESIKNEFSTQLHRFMSGVTDTRWRAEGKTVLYIPYEGATATPGSAANNKELIQRLEMTVIHWTRQIKELLSSQDLASQTSEMSGPLDEIEFWKNRCADLSGISVQLDKTGVKNIVKILDFVKSSYIAPFLKLSSQIKEGTRQAQSNLRYLMMLKQPCEELLEAHPATIGRLMPNILNTVRMIWIHSEFYNTREKLTGLLRKLSSEIIRLCCKEIDLDQIFTGHVQSSVKTLRACIECCELWKETYSKTARIHHKYSDKGWVLDQSSIFAQVDAFVQRCRDLIEVCDCQAYFARKVDGGQSEMPHFGGQRGPEILRGLLEIETLFEKNLRTLSLARKSILDIKATGWHDDYNRFRAGVKDLEIMVQNLINSAFETVVTIQQGVEVLDIFMHMSSRESIRRALDRKTVEVYGMFSKELNAAKKQFDQKSVCHSVDQPLYAGQVHWARSLKSSIERSMMVLDRATFLPRIGTGEEVRSDYMGFCRRLDDYIHKTFFEWTSAISREPMKLLDVHLLCRSVECLGMIDCNFDSSLLKLFQEMRYWERLQFEVPHYLSEIQAKDEELRNTRENILLVVRDYNRILAALTQEERGLFRERIKVLDKKIQPGIIKLTWLSRPIAEVFIHECRVVASKVQKQVDNYKSAHVDLGLVCKNISELLLVRIAPKRTYNGLEFEEDQANHRSTTQIKLQRMHAELVSNLNQTYHIFKDDGFEVQDHWHRYTERMDCQVEEAFRLNVKWSLQHLLEAINSEGKSGAEILFNVNVILDKTKKQVEFSPSRAQMAKMVGSIADHVIESIQFVSRLPDILTRKVSNKKAIHEIVARDPEINKIKRQIMICMNHNSTQLEAYLKPWDHYVEIWTVDKAAFIRRYEKHNPTVSAFEGDIARYTEVSNNIQGLDTLLTIQFVMLDCSPLKNALLVHCQEWQNKFTELLYNIATTKLNQLTEMLTSNAQLLATPPNTLDALGESLAAWDRLHEDQPSIEAQFKPLREQFDILARYEVPIPEEVQEKLEALDEVWEKFVQGLLEADVMLKKYKEKFRTNLLTQSEEFKKLVANTIDDFRLKGPFGRQFQTEAALESIMNYKAQVVQLREQENVIRKGLIIFKIDHPPSKDVAKLDTELDDIDVIWKLTLEWEQHWEQWKVKKFIELKPREMEEVATVLYKKLNKMSRDLKDRNWEILEVTRNKVDQLRRTMPLITDCNNPALRQRHWDQIQSEMGRRFDYRSDEFTLEKIVEWGFNQYAEKISEISGAATKELAIEQGLLDIAETWKSLELDLVPYKERGHFKLRSAEDLFLALDDNQVKLATMKTSRFVKAFEQDVDKWERSLSVVMETVEMLLTVQRQWMYLENIFLGEDIRRQMPKESAQFDDVNGDWKSIMVRLCKTKNAYRGAHSEGLLDKLTAMNNQLEDIQKSLDMYLETKRQIFPRFYFISNDDLLEILGQSKNPMEVQPHLKKCFDAIKSLQMTKTGLMQKFEATHMHSLDGEVVQFTSPTLLDGPVEAWLCDIEKNMRTTLKDELKKCKANLHKLLSKRDKWIREHPGQMCITASQIQWTADVTKALTRCRERGDRKALKTLKKKQVAMLNKFSDMIRTNLSKQLRLKIVALVTIEVHARDIIDRLAKSGVADSQSFDWLKELRMYWNREIDDCMVHQTSTEFLYAYEYLGNSGRLVITPLTDRCYITLTTALHLHKGGSPKGPAGTGKTETVKDLGKALGSYVIVVNCSEGLDYKSMGRMFAGLAQTGAWGCFDEFNRINIEVLSVVAQQILSIMSALSSGTNRFIFEGREIRLEWSCGIFVTMNPGYAGRTELPDNLKSMFRPISMITPDSTLIAEITLFGEGFSSTKVLAKKVFTLYSLAVQQLSKQDHYDFGLRALVSVLRYAGRKKRSNPNMHDEELLLLAMKDMNVAKLTFVDLPLFLGIVSDLFPNVETPTIDYTKLRSAVEAELLEAGLQVKQETVTKVIQLYETKNSRHSTMIVGQTMSGKSVSWRILQSTLSRLSKAEEPGYEIVKDYPLNPKALSLGEIYGEFDLNTNEWNDGVLSSLMRNVCTDEKKEERWIVFDGPVDTLWIESMNSVMDDNKILTLINGERISMPEQVSLLFEVEDLSVASPATVSRCGMVYYDYVDLGWKPYVDSWLERKQDKLVVEELRRLFNKYINSIQMFKRQNDCKELIPVAELNAVISLCKLYDVLSSPERGVDLTDTETAPRMVELLFQFSLIWSLCSSVDEDGRKKIDSYLREVDGTFPTKDSVYEYFVDPKSRTWVHWEEKLKQGWKYNPSLPFYKLIVPTVDTVRYSYLTRSLVSCERPVLLVGPVGTGKTSVAQGVLDKLDPIVYNTLTVNLSAQTTSNNVQDTLESRVEKRTKGVYVPVGGRKLVTFMDDFNMPAKDTFGSQPPLELIKLWLDYGFWYDRQKQVPKRIQDMLLVTAMGPPGGGRTSISRRLQSRFNLINLTFPQDSQIKRIFGSMISQKLQDFEEEMKPIGELMTQATIDMYWSVVARFLPTPTKIHYLFNLRDISRVFQGFMRADKRYHDNKTVMIRLWIHECFRVFSDRLVDDKDMEAFVQILSDKLGSLFDQTYHNICPNKIPPTFGDYMNADNVYEDIQDTSALKLAMTNMLAEYNNTPGVVSMDLVLFRDAIEHVSRIVRVIRQPLGNMLLIGIGGSGRQSLTRLASMFCDYEVFQVEISKHYRKQEYREDLKRLYFNTGVLNKETVFLFLDTQVVEESFLEDINNILSSGEVSNLYKPDEFEEVKNALSEGAKKEGVEDTSQALFKYLIDRVRANLHVVLGMSPVGETFRNRIRMYPALVNCTTIDWFGEWPTEALLEVADKYLDVLEMSNDEERNLKPSLAKMFATMHTSVADCSKRMLQEMRRHSYVTPTNYLELVDGYKQLLYEKRLEMGSAADKLRNGLSKIEETRVKVQSMSKELEEAKVKVTQFQAECDEFLVIIIQQKREADEQQKSVAQKSARIAEEESKCQQMADMAQADLMEAMPALEEAIQALKSLNKNDITEIKSYGRPPPLVEKVLEAVMILRGNEPTWAEAKKQLSDPNFIKQLVNFDKDNISDRVLKKISQFCAQSDFQAELVGRQSLAAKSLCLWVRAMEVYGRLYRIVEPKRQRALAAESQLRQKQAQLQEAKDKLAEVERKMQELKTAYDDKLYQKEELRKKAEHTEMMLDRASQLVSGLASERERWLQTVKDLETRMGLLVGDVLLAAAFVSYMGPFLSNYREDLVYKLWLPQVVKLGIPCDPEFELSKFMVLPTRVRDWNIQGLPGDGFSTENGVIVTRGRRWPLMIDPQGQAHKWIKNMESAKGLAVIDLQMPDYMKHVELAVQFGKPVLLQNVQEKLEASLDPVLNKSIIKIGGAPMIRLGDKEIEYNYDFRFYITTKLGNPHYAPEVASKTTIVNFAVKEQGLIAQLLGIVVRKERPELEEQKDLLVRRIAEGRNKLQQLEDMILRLLNDAKGSLLDDEELLVTLQTSKSTSQEVKEQLVISEQTEAEIDSAREGYHSSAERASILFFVLNDMGAIDPMYQFALDSYIEVFNLSIEKSQRSSKLDERIINLNEYHTFAVYRYACRGLFERHKLLFSFHMCARILEAAGKLHTDEYNFFLRGGIVMDRENQMDNPCVFLSDQAWDNITELDKLTNFHGIITSFEQYARDWNIWFTSSEPENTSLPGEWDNACNELQRMLIVRSLRPDRVSFCVTSFIVNNLGSKFIEPPVLDLRQVVEDSTTRTPLIFVLSPGVDPTADLLQIAESRGLMESRFYALSLGQGQSPFATRMIREGVREGNWVFLANCHLSLSWMPQLDKIIEQLQTDETPPHPNFRLWLSSSPHPQFPIAILQSGIKMTTEPPKGLKANMKRLYQKITEPQFSRCKRAEKYKKLLFSLCYFHSVLLERRKFLMLGWNIAYDFNDSDFEVSENLLSNYLNEYDETPWDALKFLIATINYGGHVTDDWDRRLLTTYIGDYFCEEAVATPFFKLSILPTYYIPKDGSLTSYKEFISLLPGTDHTEAFGQHPNADITSQIQETRRLFETLLSLQPAISAGSGESREDVVLELADNIKKQIPEDIDYANTVKIMTADNSPLKTVLLQEIERYNLLLGQIRQQLTDLERGIQGLVVMSSDLEEIFTCIYDARVPSSWEKAYPSMKPLASWTRDLVQRVDLFEKWARTAHPPTVFWLSAFTFPTGFLTAVLQTSARQNAISIDLLSWEFTVMTVDDTNITGAPKDGVLVKGLYLQGAGWDVKNASLVEAEPMQLVCNMPTIHFKPVEARRRTQRGVYICPCFYYPNRAGKQGRSSFIVSVDLRAGDKPAEHWAKRGAALLLSLDD